MKSKLIFIFPLIFVVIGLTVMGFGIRSVMLASESSDWPSVEGLIDVSAVDRRSSRDSDGRTSVTYHADIRYHFELNGQRYEGDQVAFGDYGSSNSGHAQSIVDRYPVGSEVVVTYRPGDPSACVLEPGLQAQAWMMPGFGLIFAGVGSVIFLVMWRSQRRSRLGHDEA